MPEVSVVGLVDYDNLFTPEPRDNELAELLEQLLKRMLDEALRIAPDVEWVELRFYGGWYENEQLSKRGSLVTSTLAEIDFFPRMPSSSPAETRSSTSCS